MSLVQTRLWGLRASAAIDQSIADASAPLLAHRGRIEHCEVQLGRWALHHGQGFTYRVSLTIESKGYAALAFEEESDINAGPESRDEILRAVFKRAASRLAAR